MLNVKMFQIIFNMYYVIRVVGIFCTCSQQEDIDYKIDAHKLIQQNFEV